MNYSNTNAQHSAVIDRLLIATQNAHKVKEIRVLLSGLHIPVESLQDHDPIPEPVEDQSTFEGNALLKARYYNEQFGLACLADDSGIEVDALDGAPGVISARYAGEECDDDKNNEKLLTEMKEVPDERRSARFVCCAALVTPDGHEHVVRGTIEGTIAHACKGANGFGYDSLFIPNGYSETFGVLDPKIKLGISHRASAFTQMKDYLAGLNR